MAISQADIEKEVHDLIDRKLAEGEPIPAGWLTHAIVQRHKRITGKDAEWYRVNAFGNVRATVRFVLQAYKISLDTNENHQVVLPGFEKLQKAYLIKRNDEQQLVPVELLTDEEIDKKIEELKKMAEGCYAHADELRRYKEARRAAS